MFSMMLKFFDCNSKWIAFTIKNFSNNSYLSKRCVFTCKEHVGSSKFRDWLSWKTWLFTAWRIAVSLAWIKRSGQHSILKLSNLKRNSSSICSYVFLKWCVIIYDFCIAICNKTAYIRAINLAMSKGGRTRSKCW